jgi:hypothetical protein
MLLNHILITGTKKKLSSKKNQEKTLKKQKIYTAKRMVKIL